MPSSMLFTKIHVFVYVCVYSYICMCTHIIAYIEMQMWDDGNLSCWPGRCRLCCRGGVKEPHGYISSCKVGTMCPDPKSFLWLLKKTEMTLLDVWPCGTQGQFPGVTGGHLVLPRQET